MPLPTPADSALVVLIVDDRDEARASKAFAMFAAGFDVMIAGDADEARVRALGTMPDVILVDTVRADDAGWALVASLKRHPLTRAVPVVAVASASTAAEYERAQRAGCDALCLASCPPATLAAGVRSVLERSRRDPGRLVAVGLNDRHD